MASNDRVRAILVYTVGIAFYFWVMNFDPDHIWVLILAVYLVAVGIAYVRQVLAVRRMVRNLRRLDPAFRRQFVNSINVDAVRDYYDQLFREEGDADVTGVVERYPFSPSDAVEQTRWYWL